MEIYRIYIMLYTNKLCIKCYKKWVLVSSTSKISCCLCFWSNIYSCTTNNFFCYRTSFAFFCFEKWAFAFDAVPTLLPQVTSFVVGLLLLSFALKSERNVLHFIWRFGMSLQSYYKKFIMYACRYIIYVMLHINKLCIKCYIYKVSFS